MKKILSIIAICLVSIKGFAQQDPMLSHYMFNGLFLNPAYAGTHPYMGATLVHRQQWLGFGDKGSSGRPVTSVVGFDGPIKKESMGIGFAFANDNTGRFKRNDLVVKYAYHLKIDRVSKLSLGIDAGAVNMGYDNSNMFTWNDASADLAFNNTKGYWSPKIGLGAYYYTKKFYAGLSLPTLYAKEPTSYSKEAGNTFNYFRNYVLLTSGYVFDVGNKIMLKPSFLLKYQKNAPMQLDLNCNAFFSNAFNAGLSARFDKTGGWLVALLGYNITPELRMGMTYDINLNGIRRYNNGSFEFMLGYDFTTKTVKIKNPRYF